MRAVSVLPASPVHSKDQCGSLVKIVFQGFSVARASKDASVALRASFLPVERRSVNGSPAVLPAVRSLLASAKCALTLLSVMEKVASFVTHVPWDSSGRRKRVVRNVCPAPPGTFRNDQFDRRCMRCPPGQNSLVAGAQFCVSDNNPCPPNFFTSSTGACLQCSVFERYNKEKKMCETCPKNSLSEGGISTRCKPCPKGMLTIPEDDVRRCVCREGLQPKLGSDGNECEKCPPGTANASPGFTCFECFEETFASRPGMASCRSCPSGFQQPLRGQTRCIPCAKGLIRGRQNECVEPATNCPPKHRREVIQEFRPALCIPESQEACPAGTAILFLPGLFGANLQCGTCRAGERYVPSTEFCEQCEQNEISPGGLTQTCTKCPENMIGNLDKCECDFGRRLVNGKCELCPLGTKASTDTCEPCPAGTFSNDPKGFCENCPPGFFTDMPGQSACKRCPKGTVSSGIGDTGCVQPKRARK